MVSSHLSRTATRQKFSLQEKLFQHLVRVFIDLDNIDYLNKKTINISTQTIYYAYQCKSKDNGHLWQHGPLVTEFIKKIPNTQFPYCNETKLSSHTAMALSTTNYQITKCWNWFYIQIYLSQFSIYSQWCL